jgi:uncharacterized protein (TIGR03435 family)
MSNNHLSPRQLSTYIAGNASPEEIQHCSECSQCAAALARFHEPLSTFLDAMGNLSARQRVPHFSDSLPSTPVIRRPLLQAVIAAVGVVAVVVGSSVLLKQSSQPTTPAVMRTFAPIPGSPVAPPFEAGLSKVSMDQIESGQIFHADGGSATTLALPDDSRVEMRARTALSFDRASDGLRILLKEGSILVSAAKQRTGHLYVQTKDVTVSVVGTVFLVKAEPEGSRVAVIEGEVHVQKGAMTERLFPGEQMATNLSMAARPVVEEISWSRHAEGHFAMLQQSAIPPAPAIAGESKDTFEVASIRPSAAPTGNGGGARGGGVGAAGPPPCLSANAFAIDLQIQLDPGRLAMRHMPLYTLIGLAYGNECPVPDALTGAPDWAKRDDYDLQATIPAGTLTYTKEQLLSGNAPQLQRMLQNLLADRFKLVLKRDVKDMQGYNMVVAQPGKLRLSGDQSADQTPEQIRSRVPARGFSGPITPGIPALGAPLSRLISMLQRIMGRPIVDKTGLTGVYDIWLEFPELSLAPNPDGASLPDPQEINQRMRDLLPAKLEATTGLKLDRAQVLAQILVIVSVERPSVN